MQALRDDAAPLGDRLAKLSAQQDAAYSQSGDPRPLAPEVVLGLYRVTQEALTNVMKHAAGATTSVRLRYDADTVSVIIEDTAASANPNPLAHSGGGYGLRGITERLGLLGGHVEAGPTPDGWRVAAVVPVPTLPEVPQDSVRA